MKIVYKDAVNAWSDFYSLVIETIGISGAKTIAEIGAGANPLLRVDELQAKQLNYQLIDNSEEELVKAGDNYSKLLIDFEKPLQSNPGQFDLIISQMTLEHIRHPDIFFENILRLLRPGGQACLFFAARTNLPMLVNRLLPDSISHKLLIWVQPFRSDEKHGKFKAYYRWCYGPTAANIRRLSKTGLLVKEYYGFFGHTYYRRLPLLHRLEQAKTRFLLKNPNPHFCTYGQVQLQKPK